VEASNDSEAGYRGRRLVEVLLAPARERRSHTMPGKQIIIGATVHSGFGVASKNIKFQMPHLIWQFPELKNIYTAAINLRLDTPLRIYRFERTTLPIPWWDVDNSNLQSRWHIERFSILPIKFEYPINGPIKEAWFFASHNSAYFLDPHRFEVVTEKIDGLLTGQQCKIHVEKAPDIDVG
jgi:hypothetical protein